MRIFDVGILAKIFSTFRCTECLHDLILFEEKPKAVETSTSDAANQLHQKVDCKPSPESNAINVSISFDISWKTRGFYFNIGFGAAISTSTKKVLDNELLSRLCEKCSIWNEDKQNKCPL